jgi:hypothetical protein
MGMRMTRTATATIDTAHESHYAFERGFPTDDTVKQAYDDADLERAIQAYKFFYPTVSGAAIVRGNEQGYAIAGPQRSEKSRTADHSREGMVCVLPHLRS